MRHSCLLAASFALCTSLSAETFLIRRVRVFDGKRITPPQDVLVADSRIISIGALHHPPAGVQVIAGEGKTLLPGLIDAHVHTRDASDLRAALQFGVTTVLDLFTRLTTAASLKQQSASGNGIDLADMRSAGTLATAPGGHGTEYGIPIPSLTQPGEATAWVEARLQEGSDFIKIIRDDGSAFGFRRPTLDKPTLCALIAAAHTHNRLAVVHMATITDFDDATSCHADILTHLYRGHAPGNWLRKLAATKVYLIPTLTAMSTDWAEGTPAAPSYREALLRETGRLHRAGVRLLAGTDCPNPGTAPGDSVHREMELLVAAGLSPLEALRAATVTPAEAFRLADRGRIAPGLRADLLLINGNPAKDIRNTRSISAIFKAGRLFSR